MLKAEVVDRVASQTGLTKKAAGEAVDSFVDVVTSALKRGDDVLLTGFGKFEVRVRSQREGRNPQTGAKINIPASKTPAFRAGKALKVAVK
ncbi:HU family DNA-binding protein [Patescibacteria group bacterium]|nr:HU family DNA-binding protein [Patescibacteria group bacterium]